MQAHPSTNRTTAASAVMPARAKIAEFCRLSGLSRSEVYRRLAAGDLHAVKVGASTLVDVTAGLAWLASQPKATFRAPGSVH